MGDGWLSAPAFAANAKVTPRSASRILLLAFDGQPWHGHPLEVRRVRGRGGNAGWAYEVRADSLPEGLREHALAGHPAPATATLPAPIVASREPAAIDKPSPVARWRYEVIQPALQEKAGTEKYRREIAKASRVVREFPSGRRGRVSARTIERWIASYERDGMAGLRRKTPANRGRDRVFISRAWDAAVPFDEELKASFRKWAVELAGSIYAENTEWGWRRIARAVGGGLAEKTVKTGFDPGRKPLKQICKVPRGLVERGAPKQQLAIFENDHKRWVDESMPRIWRGRDGRQPMEIVIGDVHPVDVLLPRVDGSTYTAKFIGWLDWGTNRVHGSLVFPPKGEGVRQEHVIEAFIAMVTDPRWGMPEHLYLDNGREYNWSELIDDAMQLCKVRHLDDNAELAASVRARKSNIIKARPYNAAAKAIEGTFAALESGVFSTFPGWIGGNRMRKKTANVGRAPLPYPHGEEAFRRRTATGVDWHNRQPQDGFLAGLSPNDAFEAAVGAGWKRTDIDPDVLRAVFSRPVTRLVWQGGITVVRTRYTAEKLLSVSGRTKVLVDIPMTGPTDRLAVRDARGKFICMAEADTKPDALDPKGGRESTRRRRVAETAMKTLRRETPHVDLEELVAKEVSQKEPPPIPERGALIGMGKALEEIARESARSPAERQAIKADKAAAEERRQEEGRRAQVEFLKTVGESAPRPAALTEGGGWSDKERQVIDAVLKASG